MTSARAPGREAAATGGEAEAHGPPVDGGGPWVEAQRFVSGCLVASAVGLALLVVAFVVDAPRAWFAYLNAWTYVTTIAVGGLVLLMVGHAAKASWMLVIRRLNEAIVGLLPICLVLFVPLLFGLRHLYPWAQPRASLEPDVARAVAAKHVYLDPAFFAVRAFVYFAVWIAFGALLRAWSLRNDRQPRLDRTRRMRALGGGGLPVLALTLTWASFDWTMSLEPDWSSTIFGLYWFAGSFVGAIALVCVLLHVARERPPVRVSPDHAQAIGRVLFAMICFWAYQAFSQLLIYWIGDVPEEIRYYQARATGSWWAVTLTLVFGHFVVPFFGLIHRGLKRHTRYLAGFGLYLLFMHLVDVYWLVMPAHAPASAVPHWSDLAALVFVGGLSTAWILDRYRRTAPLPQHEPELVQGLAYEAQL